jgi:DNA-directed RNA polymerase specialized sigma24 family protein
MAIPKTTTTPMSGFEELPANVVSYRRHQLAIIDQILDCRDRYTSREWGIVSLFYKCGESHREIAKIFHCSPGTVSYYLARARDKALS